MNIAIDAKIGRNGGNWDCFIDIQGWRLGLQYSPIVHAKDGPYLTRFIAYLGLFCLRLHKFYRGDHDRASHTHPWWFITIPFVSYMERVYENGRYIDDRLVQAWRTHYRNPKFEHIVVGPVERRKSIVGTDLWFPVQKTFWTFVIAGGRATTWGFYKPDGEFIPWRLYDTDAKE